MKTIRKLLKNTEFTHANPFSPGDLISAIFNQGKFNRCELTPWEGITCPMCGGSEGSRVLNFDEKWWSCVKSECVSTISNQKSFISKIPTVEERLEGFGVPFTLLRSTFDDWYHSEEQRSSLLDWIAKPLGTCILSGNHGVGKTYIASSLIEQFTKSGEKRARFFDAVTAKEQRLDEQRGDRPRSITYQMTESDLLVIDDIDKIKMSDSFYEFLYLVINSRYSSGKPTVITTNLTFDELSSLVGDAISSRIFAKEGLCIEIEGEDLRR